jgi:hypothetical protein
MIGKDQVGLRRNPWHMALRTGLACDVRLVTLSGMAFPAGGVVDRKFRFKWSVRGVTRQACHAPARGPETVTGRQHHRLMTRVPGILEISRIALYAWHAVALAAKIVKLPGVELSGISRTHSCRIFYVIRGRSMTTLAPDSQFVGSDYLIRRDLKGTGRVTTETAQDSRLGIKDPVLYPAPGLMTRSKSDAVELAVPCLVLLDIDLGIQPTYKCDGLYTRAKRP